MTGKVNPRYYLFGMLNLGLGRPKGIGKGEGFEVTDRMARRSASSVCIVGRVFNGKDAKPLFSSLGRAKLGTLPSSQ